MEFWDILGICFGVKQLKKQGRLLFSHNLKEKQWTFTFYDTKKADVPLISRTEFAMRTWGSGGKKHHLSSSISNWLGRLRHIIRHSDWPERHLRLTQSVLLSFRYKRADFTFQIEIPNFFSFRFPSVEFGSLFSLPASAKITSRHRCRARRKLASTWVWSSTRPYVPTVQGGTANSGTLDAEMLNSRTFGSPSPPQSTPRRDHLVGPVAPDSITTITIKHQLRSRSLRCPGTYESGPWLN